MVPYPSSPGVRRLVLALSVALVCAAGRSAAQPPTVGGFPTCLPPTPERPPRPPTGPEAVSALVDNLSTNDSVFEIIVGQGRILTVKEDFAVGQKEALIAVGDPTVIDFYPINKRQIRITGRRIGVTDLSITTVKDQVYNFEVRVVADLNVLRGQLHCLFPDASLRLGQVRDHVVVEGQARDAMQVARILETIRLYLLSVQLGQAARVAGLPGGGVRPERMPREGAPQNGAEPAGGPVPAAAAPAGAQAAVVPPQVINLIRVPGAQQVLLKVRVAELNRTAFRQIGGSTVSATAVAAGRMLTGTATTSTAAPTTVFGIFQEGDLAVFLSALRRNSLLRILAEPNLVALNGMQASFLAGGQFPVPVAQTSSGGAAPAVTVQFQEFGVRLGFVPYILDGDVIRLTVDPEVSTIDFALGTILVPGGTPVPGLNTRKAHTVVEMHPGQTLAIAGLMQLTLDGQTARIPGLGDLPIIGPFFSNTTGDRIEKELVVLVTPYLVEPMNPGQVPPTPGDEVKTPNDLEFYLLNRIEGRTGRDWRATTEYDDALHVLRGFMKLHNDNVRGPHGFCD